jgi:hypothetical protein
MKKFVLVLCVSFAAGVSCIAQENGSAGDSVFAAPLSATTAPAPRSAVTFSAPPAAATPKPEPRFIFGGSEDYRWQLGFAYTYVRFHSAPISANLNGINTTLVYYTNEWFGVEGAVTAAFSSQLAGFDREHAKLLTYSGGPRIAWRQHRWEPWSHFLIGGAHLQPQTALGGRNSLAYSAGGGADFRWNPKLAFRLQADWLHTRLYSQGQNNYQITGGFVFHF